jgi:hypothetical protein
MGGFLTIIPSPLSVSTVPGEVQHVLAYNLKRMMRIMGTGSLIKAIQA